MTSTQITEPTDEGFDARRLVYEALAVAWRRRFAMLLVFLASLAGGLWAVGTRATTYQAQTLLVVAQAPPLPDLTVSSPQDVPVVADLMAARAGRSLTSHIAIMRTPQVTRGAYEDLPRRFRGLLESGRGRRYRAPAISVDPLYMGTAMTDVIKISVRSGDPELAAALANAVARSHISFTREFNRDIARSALPYLETELESAHKKVEEAERALLAEKRRTQLFNAEEQIRAKAAAAAEAERRADEAALEQKAAQAQLAKLRATIAREPQMQTSSRIEERTAVPENEKVKRSGALVDSDSSRPNPKVPQTDRDVHTAEQSLTAEHLRSRRLKRSR